LQTAQIIVHLNTMLVSRPMLNEEFDA